MPATITGLILFVVLLAPGFAFLVRTETRLPSREYSVLRETGIVVTTSLMFDGVILLLFGLLRGLAAGLTPDVGEFVRSPSDFFGDHYVQVLAWGSVLLLLAMALAWLAAVPPLWIDSLLANAMEQVNKMTSNHRLKRLVEPRLLSTRTWVGRRRREPIVTESGWSRVMHAKPDRHVFVGLRLVDGAWLYGELNSINASLVESGDRSLILEGPVQLRPPGKETKVDERDVGFLVVQADQIKTMEVHYLKDR